jgi:hypothetical protein
MGPMVTDLMQCLPVAVKKFTFGRLAVALAVESVEQLALQKRELSERLDYLIEKSGMDSGVEQSLDVLRSHLQEFERGWSKLSVAQQKRLIKRTIVRLEVHPNMVGINFYLADGRLGFMPIDSEVRANNISEFGISKNNIIPFKTKKPTASNLSVQFSRVVNYGDDGQDRTADLEFRKLLLYPTELHRRDV